MHSLILVTQNAFINGRFITNNILIAHELVHSMKHNIKGREGKMVITFDMSKAYNRVEWAFLKNMLKALGFKEQWIKIVIS